MKEVSLSTLGIILLELKVFCDDRGYFFESFNQKLIKETIEISPTFVRDNHSKSTKGTLRRFHSQLLPKAQGKLVRVIQVIIFDAVLDISEESPTFGQSHGEKLSAYNKKQLWIPPGFLTLSETPEVHYTATEFYNPESKKSITWNDHSIKIDWPLNIAPILSKNDLVGLALKEADLK